MIRDKLKGKTPLEKANLKADEIAKIGSLNKRSIGGYEIEIININKIEGGVEVFVKVWKNKKQIGFGRDGSVDIERFKISNPPILVLDDNGDIEVEVSIYEMGKEKPVIIRYREDPLEALLESLVHTLNVKKEKFDDSKIIKGKIGNTTSTFYPDPNVESTSVDGWALATNAGTTWATIRAQAGDSANDSSAVRGAGYLLGYEGGNWEEMGVGIYIFDTSSIPDSDTISSATLSLYGQGKADNGNQAVAITGITTSSNTSITGTDFGNRLSTRFASDIDITAATTSGYNDFALNASGIANISKTGVSKFCARISGELDDSEPTLGSRLEVKLDVYNADQTGTANDPKLVVEHAAASNPNTLFFGGGL